MNKLRGQGAEGAILLFIGVTIFVMIAYALLPTVANSQAFASGQANTLVNGVAYNGSFLAPLTTVNQLGATVLAASILLAILGAGIAVYSAFGR